MKKIFLIAAAAIALASCSNDDSFVDQPIAAQISATISKTASSRASDADWAVGDEIGISMSGRYANIKYTRTDEGKFTGTTLYFKNKQDKVTLTAYYPFTGTEDTTPGTVTARTVADNQTSTAQPAIDFLFAKTQDVTGSDPKVNFEFFHKMSQITLIFKNGSGANVSNITSYTIEGLVLDGTFNPADGTCVASAVAPSQLTINPTAVTSGEKLPSLLFFPQSATSVKLKITDSDNQDYSCDLTFQNGRLDSGNNYQFTVTVNKTALVVESHDITDWHTTPADVTAD